MLSFLQKTGRAGFSLLQRPLSQAFAPGQSPLDQLGALSIFFCWIVLVSGIWLLIFFRTSVSGAFESLEYLTNEQWYLGGIMRSLHRYASDALIITVLLHIVKEFSFDRYRQSRWFSWVTGMPLIWMIFPLGITGYWLVWDELAHYTAITSAELMDAIPIFTGSMAANFLSDSVLSDRFFTLMAFLHLIGLPIFLVFGIWLHVFRISRPIINPPRTLMSGTLLAMLVLALVFPAESQDKADLTQATQVINLDWFYLHAYPLVRMWSPGWVWMMLVAITGLIVVAPWLPSGRKLEAAVVDLDNCNGCRRCADDCPYGAIDMLPRSDGKSYIEEAVVDPELCVSCGICVGACPTASPFRTRRDLVPGIDLPALSAATLRKKIKAVSYANDDATRILTFCCDGNRVGKQLQKKGEAVIYVTCMGQIPPSHLDYALSRGFADAIVLTACADGGCRHRFGAEWTAQRVTRSRNPYLRKRVDNSKIAMIWRDEKIAPRQIARHLEKLRASVEVVAQSGDAP